MCERKPGPRCSADTLKTLRDARTKLTSSIKALEEAEAVEKSRPYNFYYDDMTTSKLGDAVSMARLEFNQAEAAYDASPDGLKSLTQLIDTTGKAVEVVKLGTHTEDELSRQAYINHFVNIRIPKKEQLKLRHKLATDHREWQTRISNMLTEYEEDDPHKALFFAEGLHSQIHNEIREEATLSYTTEYYDALAKMRENPSEETEVGVAKVLLQIRRRDLQYRYNSMRLKDMESYIETLKKKLTTSRTEKLAQL